MSWPGVRKAGRPITGRGENAGRSFAESYWETTPVHIGQDDPEVASRGDRFAPPDIVDLDSFHRFLYHVP